MNQQELPKKRELEIRWDYIFQDCVYSGAIGTMSSWIIMGLGNKYLNNPIAKQTLDFIGISAMVIPPMVFGMKNYLSQREILKEINNSFDSDQ